MTCDGKMRNLLGIEAAELTPEECYNWWYDRIAEGSLKAVQEYADRIIKDGYAEITYTWKHPAWGDIYVRCGGIVDKKYEKKGTRTRGYHQDVTEITLERMTQQKKLVEALHATKRANRAKTEFLSHMSHDIRTPINGIIGLLNVADKNPDSGEIQRMTREKIGELAEHLLSLVNDVLQISAIESSEIELQEESFRLTELIENSIRLLMAQAVKKNVTIRTEYEELPYQELAGSAPHIRQILLHVIGNAIKFNRDGGSVTVRVSQEKQEDGQVMCSLEIEDTGIGMSSDYVGRVCEPFTQERSDARTNYEGTGLGMAIAKGIIEHMHGTIRIESEQGKGTTVYVQLPLKIAETKKTEEKAPKQHGNVANMKVLLVEDNEINREITQFVLEDAGVSVVNAADGQQAVRLFEASAENEFDCVLMDILMPVMDGLAATRTIRRLQRADAGTIPIIALSANAFSEDARRAIEAGMNEHMCKPVHAQTLIAMLARYRNRSEQS